MGDGCRARSGEIRFLSFRHSLSDHLLETGSVVAWPLPALQFEKFFLTLFILQSIMVIQHARYNQKTPGSRSGDLSRCRQRGSRLAQNCESCAVAEFC